MDKEQIKKSVEELAKCYDLAYLKKEWYKKEKKLIHEFTNHERCLKCGKKKGRYGLSDWCAECLEKS